MALNTIVHLGFVIPKTKCVKKKDGNGIQHNLLFCFSGFDGHDHLPDWEHGMGNSIDGGDYDGDDDLWEGGDEQGGDGGNQFIKNHHQILV
jgi:hypothetical protein